jgi:hypothetical protein
MIPEIELSLMKNFVDAHFTNQVLDGVYFISPAGKEIYKVGSRINIIWFGGIKENLGNYPFKISIYLGSTDDRTVMGSLINSDLPIDLYYDSYFGAYEWQIPSNIQGVNYNHFFYLAINFYLPNGQHVTRYTQFFKIEP